MITQELVQELFDYRDGHLYWKDSRANGKIKVGDKAGYLNKRSYFRTKINGKLYSNHRIIFLYHHGHLPDFIDHIDRNPSNNHIGNLRSATRSENMRNCKSAKNSSSKYLGVCWHKTAKKWMVQIAVDKKSNFLGYFTSETEAAAVYDLNAIKYHGEFANLNFKCPVYSIPTKAS
jgi:hypothetical protein